MKKNTQKLLAITMLVGLLTNLTPLEALTKDETVYAKLNADGTIKNISSNVHLINNNKLDVLEDETDLLNILNINGNETFTQENNSLKWNALGNDIFYKGTVNKELPISQTISYYLNGEEKSLNDILGKSGTIEIKIKYTNKEKHTVKINGINENLYTPFVVSTGFILKGNNNSNINVNNGKVINNGINYMVVGISTPGLYESLNIEELKNLDEFSISFETIKFELPNIYTVVTPKIISKDDLKVFENLNDLYQNIETLKTSIDEIEVGANMIKDGTYNLNEAVSILPTKIRELTNGVYSINKGANELNQGINMILAELSKNKNDLNNITDENINNLISTTEYIINQSSSNTYLTNLLTNNLNTLKSIMQVNTTINNNNAFIETLKQDPETNKDLIILLSTYNSILSTSSKDTLISMINTLESGLTKLKSGSEELSTGTNYLYMGVENLPSQFEELTNGVNDLYSGVVSLSEGVHKYNDEGITKIYNIVNTKVKTAQNKIEALVNLGEEYDSFTLNKEGNEAETKFIISIDGVKAKETKQLTNKSKEKENIWTRIKKLV